MASVWIAARRKSTDLADLLTFGPDVFPEPTLAPNGSFRRRAPSMTIAANTGAPRTQLPERFQHGLQIEFARRQFSQLASHGPSPHLASKSNR